MLGPAGAHPAGLSADAGAVSLSSSSRHAGGAPGPEAPKVAALGGPAPPLHTHPPGRPPGSAAAQKRPCVQPRPNLSAGPLALPPRRQACHLDEKVQTDAAHVGPQGGDLSQVGHFDRGRTRLDDRDLAVDRCHDRGAAAGLCEAGAGSASLLETRPRTRRTPAANTTGVQGSGSDLLSQGNCPQVPSALAGLTSVFGMGTGVALPP